MNPVDSASEPHLGDATRVGAVELTVTDTDRSIAFYQDALGLQQHGRENGTARLGAGGEDLVVVHENPAARPQGRHAGIYHFALLHPSRVELSRALRRLAVTRTPISGASDHGVSEAIYLADPDGIEIELYADRPREQWGKRENGELEMYVEPLDLEEILGLSAGDGELPRHANPGLVMGHVHLFANDLDAAVGFHTGVIGFDTMAHLPSAAFVAAGGYHHHLGLNTWRGVGIPPAPGDEVVGLRHWNLVLGDAGELERVAERIEAAGVPLDRDGDAFLARDPAGISVRVSASPA
jgi:catechol 2,3-dioxygenase